MMSNLFSSKRGNVSNESIEKLQREKAFLNFIVKHRYDVAKTIFQESNLKLHEVIELFKWLYPKEFLDQLSRNFEVYPIPYFNQLDTEQRKGIQGNYVKPVLTLRQMLQLKTFMPFFKEKLEQTLKDLSNVTIDLKAM